MGAQSGTVFDCKFSVIIEPSLSKRKIMADFDG